MRKLLAIVLCMAMCLGMLAMTASAAEDIYVVAGSAELCGSGWDTSDMNNAMTKASDGTYSITYTNVPAGTYEFKVVKNSDWNTSWPGSNYILTLDTAQDVTIVFDPSTNSITIAGKGDAYVVAGSEGLCGENWNGTSTKNVMTKKSDGTYSLTFEDVAPGNYEYKIVLNGSTWYGDANGANYSFAVTRTCDVTITFDPATEKSTVSGSGIGEAVAPEIEFMAIRGSGATLDWEADNVKMTKVSDGVYEYTFKNLSNVSLEMKFAANGNWDDYNFGGSYVSSGTKTDAVWNGGNINIGITDASDVTVKLDLTGLDYSTKQGATFTVTVTPVATSGGDDTTGDDTTGDDTTGGDDTTAEVEMITVYAKVPSDWTSVSAYIWDGNGTDNTWPGAAMTKGDDGWWTVEIPAWGTNIIINNGGNGAQTQDIAIEAGKDFCVVVEAVEGGYNGKLTYGAPKTGDGMDLVALSVAMILAAAGCAVVAINKNKLV